MNITQRKKEIRKQVDSDFFWKRIIFIYAGFKAFQSGVPEPWPILIILVLGPLLYIGIGEEKKQRLEERFRDLEFAPEVNSEKT